ncbi:hypothetical protein [Streptomyces sp. SD31]|uniref:hypothetical protein n=1 Tax=Streptomyces sp. SD31 TaxID=3452208 RepID=UPI003F8CE75A
MSRIVAVLLACALSAALAAGAAFGLVTALTAAPEQPNVPLVTFPEPAGDRAASVPRTPTADR